MRALAVMSISLTIGCYSPTVPSAGFLCGDDGACPGTQTCVCGTCVNSPAEAACFLRVEIVSPPACSDPILAGGCVHEDEPFNVKVTATVSDDARAMQTGYSGAVTLESTWGNVLVGPDFTSARLLLAGGSATASVKLDRATPPNGSLVLEAHAGNPASGSQGAGSSKTSLAVNPRPLVAEPTPLLTIASGGWVNAFLGFPGVDVAPDGTHRLFFTGVTTSGVVNPADIAAEVGVATSTDDKTYTVQASPRITGGKGTFYLAPSALRDGSTVRLFFTSITASNTHSVVQQAVSTDSGATFPTIQPLMNFDCGDACSGTGALYPSALHDPHNANDWLLYLTGVPTSFTTGMTPPPDVLATFSPLLLARTADSGGSWALSHVPTPGTGTSFSEAIAVLPRVLYDPRSALWRMWYATGITNDTEACHTVIYYATSADGVFWTGANQQPAFTREMVGWAAGANPYQKTQPIVGVYTGAVDIASDGTYRLWYSPVIDAGKGFCLPVGVGRATRM